MRTGDFMAVVSAQPGVPYTPADCGLSLDLAWIRGVGAVSIAPGFPVPGRRDADPSAFYAPALVREDGTVETLASRPSRIERRWPTGCVIRVCTPAVLAERRVEVSERGIEITDTVMVRRPGWRDLVLMCVPVLAEGRSLALDGAGRSLRVQGPRGAATCVLCEGEGAMTLGDARPMVAGSTRPLELRAGRPVPGVPRRAAHRWTLPDRAPGEA